VIVPVVPGAQDLCGFVAELLERGPGPVILVDDGAGPAFRDLLGRFPAHPRLHAVRHTAPLGSREEIGRQAKPPAPPFNHVLLHFADSPGVIVVSAAHSVAEIGRLAASFLVQPASLVAAIDPAPVSRACRLGGLLAGGDLAIAHSTLWALPAALLPHLLRLPAQGEDFHLDLLLAARLRGVPVTRLTLSGPAPAPRFYPVRESMRLRFLLLRFGFLSFLTAVVDNLFFAAAWTATAGVAQSQVIARLAAMAFNYSAARSAVFHSSQPHRSALPRYVALVAFNGFLSYSIIELLRTYSGMPAIPAKLLAEGLLFLASFAVQRDFVFSRGDSAAATDWEAYYRSVPFTARLTRRYSAAQLVKAVRRHAAPGATDKLAVVEFGGANSCFLDSIAGAFPCRAYDVVDTSQYGLSLLEGRQPAGCTLRLHARSVFAHGLAAEADLAFSAGLVEHFPPAGTRDAILAHLDALRPGGVALITFPTPTWLYRAARSLLESLGLWRFPDERPLAPSEAAAALAPYAEILESRTLWPLILTQHWIVARKRPGPGSQSAALTAQSAGSGLRTPGGSASTIAGV
jgi:putative flippase GtrA